jgi:hypothetical protein
MSVCFSQVLPHGCVVRRRVLVLVFTETRVVLIEGWLVTAIGRVRLSRSAAFSLQWHRASTHSDPADRSSMPRR